MSKKLTIQQMQNFAKVKKGECLSKKYINAITCLKWRCKDGHVWEAQPNWILNNNTWCPICSEGISERVCRKFFEKIFKVPFAKVKYDWLLSPKGEKLEIDGYNKKLNLAFEYQGRQHYMLCGMYRDKNRFAYLQECDKIKRDKCKEKGITLIEVPYTIKYDDMEKYILNQTNCSIPFQNLNYRKWDIYSLNRLKEMQKVARSRKGCCLSKQYINDYTELEWKCSKGHKWMATPNNVKRSSWCPYCAGNIRNSLEDLRKVAKIKKGECLSDTYINTHTKLKWRCKEGHEWDARPHHVLRGSWCPICAWKKPKGL